MKAKAASKSTNWNLRVIASRSLASCQSGSRFSAAFSSSIVNFAIEPSQGIFLFYPVDAAIAGQLAGIKTKRPDREFVAGVERVVRQPYPHPFQFGMAQPRQRNVRGEFVGILRLADPTNGAIHLALQMIQQIIPARRRPQRMGLLVT